jgi:dTDP-L-rhamnose 4-epimerase
MPRRVLITGGAGFIGSHLADELIAKGYKVRILDCLLPQVHGTFAQRPSYLNPDAELTVGDIRDTARMRQALKGVDMVVHLAAAVGVGQSMYEIEHYTSINNLGTASLLQSLVSTSVEKLVVASSMSIYGEGAYRNHHGDDVDVLQRKPENLRTGHWEVVDNKGEPLTPVPTPETKRPDASSIYALSKFDQERMCMLVGEAYKIPTVALRFFNVYGPRQALSNPYTGVLAIFSSQLLNRRRPTIYEDGHQMRDFVNVHDVALACRLALEVPTAAGNVLNVGSGQSITILEVAEKIASVLSRKHLTPIVSGKYRIGDIRHCFADISRAKQLLGYEPKVDFEAGIEELAQWLGRRRERLPDMVAKAQAELTARGLMV